MIANLCMYKSSGIMLYFFLIESDCEYRYTEQPLNDPTCSPYGIVMRINCTVEVPRDASDISIGWFLDCMELSNDSHVTISTQDQYTETVRRIKSQLVITDMNDDYAGEYTCNILGDEEFIPSNLFRLPDSTYLEVYMSLGPCRINEILSIEEMKCAEITENRTIPMSLSCADPVAVTSHAGTTITSTPVIQSTPTPSLLAALPMSSLPISSLPSYTPAPSTPRTTTPPSSPIVTDPTDSSATDDPKSIWLYVVVAVAAVFFMIIIILAIVFVGMCLRRQQSVTIDEQTLKRESQQLSLPPPLSPSPSLPPSLTLSLSLPLPLSPLSLSLAPPCVGVGVGLL